MASDQPAVADINYYELLGVEQGASNDAINRAWRKLALKYHPDKNLGNSAVITKFHQLQEAQLILTTESTRTAFDNALNAKLAKKRREEAYGRERTRLREDLEARERSAAQVARAEAEFAAKLESLRAETARMRQERLKDLQQEQERKRKEYDQAASSRNGTTDDQKTAEFKPDKMSSEAADPYANASEEQRTLKVRILQDGSKVPKSLDEKLRGHFEKFGSISAVALGRKTCLIVFDNILSAEQCIESEMWRQIEWIKGVTWLSKSINNISDINDDASESASTEGPLNESSKDLLSKKYTNGGVNSKEPKSSKRNEKTEQKTEQETEQKTEQKTEQIRPIKIPNEMSDEYERQTMMRLQEMARKRKAEQMQKPDDG